MEELQSNNSVEIVIKTISSDGIFMKNIKEHTNKTTGAKAAEYFLNLKSQNEIVENIDDQFVAVAEDCEDNENQQYVTVEVQDSDGIILNEKEVIIWDELCRICANSNEQFIPIFSGEGLEHDLYNKINSYLPVKVSENDSLPHQICYNCAATLLSWHDMFKGCIEAHQRLTELQNKFNSKDEFSNDSTEEIIDTVFEVETVANEESEAQSCREVKQERLPDTPSELERTAAPAKDAETKDAEPKRSKKTAAAAKPHPELSYMCGVCEKLFAQEPQLLSHLKTDHPEKTSRSCNAPVRYECNLCGKSYTKKRLLIKHVQLHGLDIPGEDGILEKSKIFVNKSLYYKCQDCNSVLRTRRSFLRHVRVHTDERPVICDLCGKSWRIEADLKRHVDDVHAKIKRYACDICNVCFAAKATRDAHRRIHTGEKPFPCELCGKFFRSINLLGIHRRIHSDHRPYKCGYCDKAFRDKQKLQVHESIHTGVKPYDCDICGKTFAAKGELGRHRSVHFDDKPYRCAECNLGFRLSRYLRVHIKKDHAEKAEDLLKKIVRQYRYKTPA